MSRSCRSGRLQIFDLAAPLLLASDHIERTSSLTTPSTEPLTTSSSMSYGGGYGGGAGYGNGESGCGHWGTRSAADWRRAQAAATLPEAGTASRAMGSRAMGSRTAEGTRLGATVAEAVSRSTCARVTRLVGRN